MRAYKPLGATLGLAMLVGGCSSLPNRGVVEVIYGHEYWGAWNCKEGPLDPRNAGFSSTTEVKEDTNVFTVSAGASGAVLHFTVVGDLGNYDSPVYASDRATQGALSRYCEHVPALPPATPGG